MVQNLGKEALVEYSGREQEVRVSTPGRKLVEKTEAGENCFSYVEAVGQGGGGEAQMVEAKRKERIQELETLVAMLGDSIHLEDYKQKATEETELLKKKGVDKRPLSR